MSIMRSAGVVATAAAIIAMSSSRLPAQGDDAGRAAFEVASIRLHQGHILRTEPLTVSNSLIRVEGYTLFGLVLEAYHLRDYQLAFGTVARPDDVYDVQYDIIARTALERVPSIDETRAMLQTLLSDRFKFRSHRETKEVPIYALVSGKNRARWKPSSKTGPCSVRVGVAKDGRNTEETFSGCPIERLADRLGNIGDRPVLDQTGLTGKYDFRLVATPASRSLGRSDPTDISVNVAVGELGLRLIPQKARIDILAVDHFEGPTEN